MKNSKPAAAVAAAMALIGAAVFGNLPAQAGEAEATGNKNTPTNVTVTNKTKKAVYATLVLGQPPVTAPANCSNLGKQITSVVEADLKFTSSIPNKKVKFTPQVKGVTTKGYYQLAAGETITYRPQTFKCHSGAGVCSPAMTFNFFFTPNKYSGNPNNGCGGSKAMPNATNLAEGSINFGINDSKGSSCANADAVDISAVNGINSSIEVKLHGASWPFADEKNSFFGHNANQQGVYGWAATNCVNNAGYPNPSPTCDAPNDAPPAPAGGKCTTPGGASYDAIVDPVSKKQYCDERSDSTKAYPQGQCVSQRPGNVTGGTVQIFFAGFLHKPVPM